MALCGMIILVASVFGTATGTEVSVENGSLSDGSVVEEDAEEIHDWHDLNDVRNDLEGDYVLMEDLDEDTDGYDELVGTAEGWLPIDEFLGDFDGNEHEIRDLYIDRPEEDDVGLFGDIDLFGKVTDLVLVDVDVNGSREVGALVGTNSGTVTNTSVTGTVTGENRIGGLGGWNLGMFSDSYSACEVSSEVSDVGGLVGMNDDMISNSYATGSIDGQFSVGVLWDGTTLAQ